jgi:hypothetical protein
MMQVKGQQTVDEVVDTALDAANGNAQRSFPDGQTI